ncbi:MAG: hypothetical protein LBN39_13670 [Planctomycetaceae bacterium]|jgi:hypothetical protein|nr:hypothetical protein [Planctomycetaceae bacterium]
MAAKTSKKKKRNSPNFLVLHIEKIIFALVIPAAVYIAYQGTQYKGLTWQPDVLVQASTKADTFVKSNNRKAADEGVETFSYDTYATWIKTKIKPELYQTDTTWLPSLFPEKNKRGKVEVFPVHDLKASSGLGAVTINPASPLGQERLAEQNKAAGGTGGSAVPNTGTMGMGSSGMTGGVQIGERWAIVTGLIPIKQQLDEYVSAFSTSTLSDPVRDFPSYYLYDVERAEIEPGKADPNWEKLEFITVWKEKTTLWAAAAGFDPVDPTYLAPVHLFPMAYPLPPVAKKYNEDVVHPPVVPMMTESQVRDLKDAEKVQKKMFDEMLKLNQADLLENGPAFSSAGGGAGIGMGTDGGMSGGGMGMGTGMGMGSGPDMGGTGTSGRTTRRQREAAKKLEEELKPVVVTDFLFRFLDFKVKAGKSYKYRVRLYLANPNYELQANFLEQDALAKEKWLITEWSETSNMVTIPLESRILTSDITAANARTPWDEPYAKITMVYFDMNDGSEWYAEKDRVSRGTTCNFKKLEVTNPALEQRVNTGGTMDSDMGVSSPPRTSSPRNRPSARGTTAAAPKKDKEDKQTIEEAKSNVCVLDMLGGQPLYKTNFKDSNKILDLKSPSKMLVLEPSGNIVIHALTVDLAEIEQMKYPKGQIGMDAMGGSGMMMGSP